MMKVQNEIIFIFENLNFQLKGKLEICIPETFTIASNPNLWSIERPLNSRDNRVKF